MASSIQPFVSENGVSPEERRNSTQPFTIAQAPPPKTAPKPSSGELGLKAKFLEPFRFVRDGVTIRGAISPDGASFLDTAESASPDIRPALRQKPSDKVLGEIVTAVTTGNRFIKERRDQVKDVLIHSQLSSSFVLLDGELPLALLQARQGDVTGATTIHEMGHAIFNSFRRSRPDLARVICHSFLGLTAGAVNRREELARLPGIRMVSFPEWSNDLSMADHPQGDADEFWASSLTGFMINPTGFRASIDRATKEDRDRVGKFGPDLLVFIGSVVAEVLRKVPFSKRMRDLITESNTPEAIALLEAVPKPGHVFRQVGEKGDIVRLLMAL